MKSKTRIIEFCKPYMRLAIAITFFYRYSRLEYLRKVCQAHCNLGVEQATYIVTNTSDRSQISRIKECVPNKDLHIITPSHLGHPYLLTWMHRDVFRELLSGDPSFSHFLYTEDDILFTKPNLGYWLTARHMLKETGLIPGFLRWEINQQGVAVSTDVTESLPPSSVPWIKVDETVFASLKEPYQGMYLMDRELAIEFLYSDASSPDTGKWQIREKAAQGLTYWKVPKGLYSRIVIALTSERMIEPTAQVHHLPNNYADDPTTPLAKVPVDQVIKND